MLSIRACVCYHASIVPLKLLKFAINRCRLARGIPAAVSARGLKLRGTSWPQTRSPVLWLWSAVGSTDNEPAIADLRAWPPLSGQWLKCAGSQMLPVFSNYGIELDVRNFWNNYDVNDEEIEILQFAYLFKFGVIIYLCLKRPTFGLSGNRKRLTFLKTEGRRKKNRATFEWKRWRVEAVVKK